MKKYLHKTFESCFMEICFLTVYFSLVFEMTSRTYFDAKIIACLTTVML